MNCFNFISLDQNKITNHLLNIHLNILNDNEEKETLYRPYDIEKCEHGQFNVEEYCKINSSNFEIDGFSIVFV